MSMAPICCIKIVKSLLFVWVFGKITENSKSDFDLSTLTATKFCKWLNLFRRILKSIFLSPHWSKSFKSLPAQTVYRQIVVAIFFVYSIININSPFDSLDEAPLRHGPASTEMFLWRALSKLKSRFQRLKSKLLLSRSSGRSGNNGKSESMVAQSSGVAKQTLLFYMLLLFHILFLSFYILLLFHISLLFYILLFSRPWAA